MERGSDASFGSFASSDSEARSLPKRVLFHAGDLQEGREDAEYQGGEDAAAAYGYAHGHDPHLDDIDAHSELDPDLYDAEDIGELSGRGDSHDGGGELRLEHLSLASDDFGSILSTSPDDDEIPGIPAYLHNPNAANSFVSVGGASEFDLSQRRMNVGLAGLSMSHHGQQSMVQGQPRPQYRIYDAPSMSNRPPGSGDGATSTISSSSGPYGRSHRFPAGRPEPLIRTNFTAAAGASGAPHHDVGTPQDSAYDAIGTPPGDPPSSRPGEDVAVPGFSAKDQPLPKALRVRFLFVLMVVGFTVGAVVLNQDPPEALGYWLNLLGDLYIRVLNCVTLPMAFCQVLFSVSTLTSKHTLARLWAKTVGLFLVVLVLSGWMAIGVAFAFQSLMAKDYGLGLALSYPTFAFQCSNALYLEQLDDGSLACSAANVTANSTFPQIVDLEDALGLPESFATVDYTGYVFALVQRYVPSNIVVAFSQDYQLSVMVLATVLGVAVTRSFRGLQSRSNPLLRLFVHMYAALFTVLEWVQHLSLVAALPLTAGSLLAANDSPEMLRVAGYYCLACVTVAALECLVVCPLVFWVFTRRNPFGWLSRVVAPVLHCIMLQSPLLPLGAATRVVMRSREVPPPVFGGIFPPLAATNRIAQALGLPIGLVFVASVSGCDIQPTASNIFLLFGLLLVASLGDTALTRSQLAYFLTAWRLLCNDADTPPAVLAIAGIGLIIRRLGALANFLTNIMLVRMAASTEEGRLHAEQHLVG